MLIGVLGWWGLLSVAFAYGIDLDGVKLEIKTKQNNGVILQETFTTNTDFDTITNHFQLSADMICWTLYDFLNKIKVFKVDILGEPELGQKQYQSICFVTKLENRDIIPPDSMSKLRQKSSGSLQEPDDILKNDIFNADLRLEHIDSYPSILGKPFHTICASGDSIIYTREEDLEFFSKGTSEVLEILKSSVVKLQKSDALGKCTLLESTPSDDKSCICKVPFLVPWYPCLVKYCQTKNSKGRSITTRCGIRSCKKSYEFSYVAEDALSCHWGVT